MTSKCIHEKYLQSEGDHSILSYKGIISAELLTELLDTTESKLMLIEPQVNIRKKVYNVLVECLQNLYHHIEETRNFNDKDISKTTSVHDSIVALSKSKDQYNIKTGNFINSEKIELLRSKIDQVNKLDKESLRTEYKAVLNDGKFSKKGTAGLGLMDIARKSGNKLNYSFETINDKQSFFCLTVKINSKWKT